MKNATVADLRNNFRRISSWIEHGETVQIMKRGKVFACLTASSERITKKQVVKPDIMAQLKEVWGKRCFTMREIHEMKDSELENDRG